MAAGRFGHLLLVRFPPQQAAGKGLSLDHISKFQGGENNTKLNPLIGVKFTPSNELDFYISVLPAKGVRAGFYGLLGSKSWWWNTRTDPPALLEIPSYFNLDGIVSYEFRERTQVFLKLCNIFDRYFYTEPGFPWRGRYFEVGLRLDVLK